jgi:hypothetical protein
MFGFRLRTYMVMIAVIAVMMGVYYQNVVKRERTYKQQWAAWRAAMTARDRERAKLYRQRALTDKYRASVAARKAVEHPDQNATWLREAGFWSWKARQELSLADGYQAQSKPAPPSNPPSGNNPGIFLR